MKSLEQLGRVRLSDSFFMRDFLYSEISNFYAIPNFPDDPKLAIAAGKQLCAHILEPLQEKFGRISIRSAYRSQTVNRFGNDNKLNCSRNESDYAGHIWDRRDANGNMGAMACIVVNSFLPYYERTGHWQALAWWIHDHLPYSEMTFFPKLAAFNISWNETPKRTIYSFISPNRGYLTKPGDPNHGGNDKTEYAKMLETLKMA
jgi:hypothetical protein